MMQKNRCGIMDSCYWRLIVPEGLLLVILISFFCTKYGASYGVKLAMEENKKNEQTEELNKFKSDLLLLFAETKANGDNIRNLQGNAGTGGFHLTPLSTKVTEYFLLQPESHKYPTNTLLRQVSKMNDAYFTLEETNEIMIDQWKKNGHLTNVNVRKIKEVALYTEARINMVLDMINEQANRYGMKNDIENVLKNQQGEEEIFLRIMEKLQQEYGVSISH